jgi:hypothetical protein
MQLSNNAKTQVVFKALFIKGGAWKADPKVAGAQQKCCARVSNFSIVVGLV